MTASERMVVAEGTDDLLRLAGYALAHAAWSVSTGETLVTMAMVQSHGQRELIRFVDAESIPESVGNAYGYIESEVPRDALVALVFDGYATEEGGPRRDALIVELFADGARVGGLIQPYEPGQKSRIPFVGRTREARLLEAPIVLGDDLPEDAQARVLVGAREHDQAARFFAAF